MKKVLGLVLAVFMAFAVTACGNSDNGNNPSGNGEKVPWETAKRNAAKVTIYVDESNIYGAYVKGSDEAYVKDCIEKKFYEDTGEAINMEIMYETHDSFNTRFGGVMTTGQWDAAVSYLGQAGLEETVLTQDVSMNLADVIADNGENLLKAVDKEAMYAVTTLTGEVIGIPSVNKTKMKNILVRKDFMTQAGYTESKAEADASGGTLTYCRTINDFTNMLRAMKTKIPGCNMPLIGNPYDLEFAILTGACGTAGYQYKAVHYNADGSVKEVVPGWLSEGYDKMLAYEYMWQHEGLWEADNTVKTDEKRISDFSNGKAGVYCADPNILNLISVARQVKTVAKDATFTVLGPLDAVDERGNAVENSGRFAEVSRTTDCLIVNKRSKNASLLVKYLNWMYSDTENYELCRYGVKGTHWVDVREGFYAYPEGKEDRYFVSPPYSGVFALLHNDEFAYRLYDSYSEEELGWIEKTESAATMKNATDAMLFYNMPAAAAVNFTTAEANMYQQAATPAWNGSGDPATTYPAQDKAYREQAKDYIEWLTDQYKRYLQIRALDA
ncbi:MAG: hypothetical protein HFE47_01215 [Clostridia bacterium]|nr:hypothetical protein [Clostridia bacterium]